MLSAFIDEVGRAFARVEADAPIAEHVVEVASEMLVTLIAAVPTPAGHPGPAEEGQAVADAAAKVEDALRAKLGVPVTDATPPAPGGGTQADQVGALQAENAALKQQLADAAAAETAEDATAATDAAAADAALKAQLAENAQLKAQLAAALASPGPTPAP